MSKSIGGPRGLLRLYVLHRLSKERMSGYDLISSINALTGGTWHPASGSIYPILEQLKKEKMIEVVSKGYRSKQTYALTRKGEGALQAQSSLLNDFATKWNRIRLALLDLVTPENLSTAVMESTKVNRQAWRRVIEAKMPRSEVSFRLREYKLLLESELDWVRQELREEE